MRRLLCLLALLAAAAGGARAADPNPVAVGEVRQCAAGGRCVPAALDEVRLAPPETVLVRTVAVSPSDLSSPRPLMVWVVALASSEVSWNGVVIGRNGVPGPDRARERPGRFFATFVVPPRLVRPGENVVSARLSAHHLWLPVRRPVHIFDVGPYETTALPGLASYLPALLAMGALIAAGVYFAAAAALDRRDRGALLLALIAATATLQLLAETARTFLSYTYPWHLARVSAVALLAAATAVLIAAYSARRFAPEWRRPVVLHTGAAALVSVVLVPWYDVKALGAIVAGMMALLICAGRGARAGVPRARAAMAAGAAILALLAWQLTLFLDQAYYLALGAVLVALAAEQLLMLRQARSGRDAEAKRADGLEQRLRSVGGAEAVVLLRDGARTHRLAEPEILFIKAADDYCEVQLVGGRRLLVTSTLARLGASLPEGFVRVHKSYVVNRGHVRTIAPRPGGGRIVVLSDGSSVPLGRSYAGAAVGWLAPAAAAGG